MSAGAKSSAGVSAGANPSAELSDALEALSVGGIKDALLQLAASAEPLRAADACSQLRALLLEDAPRSWHLEVRPSEIAGAGGGLFLCGSCEVGVVVALYPGTAYHVDDLKVMAGMVLEGNSYVLARRDGVLIDGRPEGLSAQLFDTAIARERAAAAATGRSAAADGERPGAEAAARRGAAGRWADLRWPAHPLAAGNMANHPPRGRAPNVGVCVLDLRVGEEAALHCALPFASFRPPATGEPVKLGAALVSTRRLENEEILLDYKLRADGPLEPWYVPYEPGGVSKAGDEGVAALRGSEPERPPIC